jgi:outer membrane protein assembly factor BamB
VALAWVAAAGCLGGLPLKADDWPQFLGPQRNGISAEKGLLETWPDGGLKVVWRAPGGVGMSGLSVQGDRLVTLVQRQGRQWLVAHDAKTGQPLWQTDLAPEYKNSMGNGPRGTPAIVGEQVFAYTGEGLLVAADLRTGKIAWTQETLKVLKGKEADYGMACSPLVVGGHVIVTVGAPQATVVAFDAKTGKQAWATGSDPAGYSSPTVLKVGGREQIVAFTGASAIGLGTQDGQLLWRFPYSTNFDCNIATPLAIDGQVFLSSGENHGSILLKLTAKGAGFEPTEVWSSFGPKSSLRSEWQTPILLDGHLYGMDNVGGAGPVTHLNCVDAKTGERKWQQQRYGKGNFIYADGKLFLTMMTGELIVLRPAPDRYVELGSMPLVETTRQAPALAGGLLYARDDKEIVCVDVRKK